MNISNELEGLERMLDFHSKRHGVLASNLANADTPGFEAQDLRFDASLLHANGLVGTHRNHIGTNAQQSDMTVEHVAPEANVDGNGVSVDHTLAQVTANRLRYESGVELAGRQMALMRYAATDGSH